jgi:arylsulfatase A-like enzyme
VPAAHLVLALLVQCENCAHLAAALPGGGWRRGALFAELPFLQLQNLAVAGGLALLAWLCARRLWWLLPQLLLLLLNALLIVDQLVWSVFLSHLDVTPGDLPWASLAALRSSAWAAAGWQLALNLAAAAALGVWAWRGAAHGRQAAATRAASPEAPAAGEPAARSGTRVGRRLRWPPRWPRWPLWAALAWAVATVALSALADGQGLEDHPLRGVLASAFGAPPPGAEVVPLGDLWAPRFDRQAPAPGEDERLRAALARLRRLRRPNILLVVLESVGARQLLPQGAAARVRTPQLAELLREGVVFTAVYTPFPATTRAHLALETGGAVFTWGDFASSIGKVGGAAGGAGMARRLATLGYRTAVFSAGDLAPENLGDLLSAQGYDYTFDPGRQPRGWRTAHEVSSWGVDEDAVRAPLRAWLARPDRRPWFVQLLTVSTHHPYLLPMVRPVRDLEGRYRAAVGYADEVLGNLLRDLAAGGRLGNTIVLLTGDHGEAFGNLHSLNTSHRNFLYDENVRSFLIVLAPGAFAGLAGPVVSTRVGSLGDVAPTLLDAIGALAGPPAGMNGQSLWPDLYRPRIAYFSKKAEPEKWGLRDGRWKFIARLGDEKRWELYDLVEDPDEQTNLAASRPAQTALYDRLCAHWYASAGADFHARLRAAPAAVTPERTLQP